MLIETLKKRFDNNMTRHQGISWTDVESKLTPSLLEKVQWMEETSGEPDVVLMANKLLIVDCSKETPTGRRSLCYDDEALRKRKKNKPVGSVMALADKIGVHLINQQQYEFLQTLEPLDLKTSSWLFTPENIRQLGGAIWGENRYNTVFIGANGADSYYSSRGFRVFVEISYL